MKPPGFCLLGQSGPYCNCCLYYFTVADLCIYHTLSHTIDHSQLFLFFSIWPLNSSCQSLSSCLSDGSFVLQGKHANHTEHLPPEGYGECTLLLMFPYLNIKRYHVVENPFPVLLSCAPGNVVMLSFTNVKGAILCT